MNQPRVIEAMGSLDKQHIISTGLLALLVGVMVTPGRAQPVIPATTLILAQSESASCYDGATRTHEQKRSILKALAPYVDILELFVYPGHLDDTDRGLHDIQEWIDLAHAEGLMIALACDTVPREKDFARAVGFAKLKAPKPTEVVAEDGSLGELKSLDLADARLVKERAQRLRAVLSRIRDLDFYMFDETLLPMNAPEGFNDFLAEAPYFCSSTYSDAALADFRRYLGTSGRRSIRFPIRSKDRALASSPEKFMVTEDPKVWDRWWKWRFSITQRYIDAMARAAHEANAKNRRFRGVIYFQLNRWTYEAGLTVEKRHRKIYAVNIDDLPFEYEHRIIPGIAASKYVDWLISEDGADGQNPTLGPSESIRFFRDAAKKHGKKWGNFLECWTHWNKTPGDVERVRKAIEITAKYECPMLAMYEEGVFRREQFPRDFNNYHPEVVALWKKMVAPRRHKNR